MGDRLEIKRKVSAKALEPFRQRIRQLTARNGGRSMTELGEPPRRSMLGWKGYFGWRKYPRVWRALDESIRHRLRAIQLKHWRRGTTMSREVLALVRRQREYGWWRQIADAGGATATWH